VVSDLVSLCGGFHFHFHFANKSSNCIRKAYKTSNEVWLHSVCSGTYAQWSRLIVVDIIDFVSLPLVGLIATFIGQVYQVGCQSVQCQSE